AEAFSQHLHSDDRGRLREIRRAVAVDGRERSCDLRMLDSDGGDHWFLTRIRRADNGDLVGVMVDVGARRRDAEEMRRSRDRLDVTLKNLAEGVMVQDATGRLIYANEVAARNCGCETSAELVAIPTEEVLRRFSIYDTQGNLVASEQLPGRRALR